MREKSQMSIQYKLVHKLSEDQQSQLLNLYRKEWWSKNRTPEDVNIILQHSSLLFAYIQEESARLIGFARVLSDFYKYAYIYDVIIEPSYRKLGLGKKMIDSILQHPQLNCLKNIELTCLHEMAPFYEKFGFSKNYGTTIPMRKSNPNGKKE